MQALRSSRQLSTEVLAVHECVVSVCWLQHTTLTRMACVVKRFRVDHGLQLLNDVGVIGVTEFRYVHIRMLEPLAQL